MRDDQAQTSAAALLMMAQWHSQRPSFALMGEFSAGKSTLLNLLLGRAVLPAMVTATKLPVIWLTHGTTPACHGLTFGGDLHALPALTPSTAHWERYAVVRLVLDAPMLQDCDIIDTPGISDPRLATGSLRVIADFADFAIWCTAANQAWRQSEKAAWSALPARLRADSILAITRADMMKPADLAKVAKRMRSETQGLFATICPIATPLAMGRRADDPLWHSSGAADLMAAIATAQEAAQTACAARSATVSPAPPQPAAAPLPQQDLRAIWQKLTKEMPLPATKDKVLAIIEQFDVAIAGDSTLQAAQARVLARCLQVDDRDGLDYAQVLMQVQQDVEDFANDAWCRLA